jgi:hypothetical protein
MFNPFSWLYKKRTDLEEPLMPEIRFLVKEFTLVCADKRKIQELGNPKEGYEDKGLYFPNAKEIWTTYTLVKGNVVPNARNLRHEILHHIEGESGDWVDKMDIGNII